MKRVGARPFLLSLLVCAVTAVLSVFIPTENGIVVPILLRGLLIAAGVAVALFVYRWDSRRH